MGYGFNLFFSSILYCIVSIVCDNDFLKLNGSVLIGKKLHTILENKPYLAFWKIPYAEAPVGKLRFKPPKSYQNRYENDLVYDYSKFYNETCSSGHHEDCLYLSVFVPICNQSSAVMVWINEYSNYHAPDFFIDEQLIVITVSYRTGVFGFLNTGDHFAQGNMGAKDVLMALKWIRDNIAFINGDLQKIAVMGSGTGATLVASLLLSTAARNLFSRVLILDGSALSPADYGIYTSEIINKLYSKLSGSFNNFSRKKLYERLIDSSTNSLLSASRKLFDSTEVRDNQRLINSFCPSVENSKKYFFMNETPLEVYERKVTSNNVQVIIGYNSLESLYKLRGFVENKMLLKYLNYNFQYILPFEGAVEEYGSKRYKKIKQRIMDFYFINGTIGERSLRRYAKYLSDQVIYPLIRQTRLHARLSHSYIYLYRFSFNGCLNVGWRSSVRNLNFSGATSGDEICYLFRCKSVNDVYNGVEAANERHFIKKIARLWANFVKCGNPTPHTRDEILGDLQWKPLNPRRNLCGMKLGNTFKMIKLPEEKRVKFWDQLRHEIRFDDIK